MKKIRNISLICLSILVVVLFNVKADNLELSTNGFGDIGENEVQIIKILSFNNAEITLNGDFKQGTYKKYTVDEINDGTFDRERTEEGKYTGYNNVMSSNNTKFIMHGPLDAGEHNITGSIKLKWKKAAQLQDDSLLDIEMVIYNIAIKTNRDTVKPIILLASPNSGNSQINFTSAFTGHECTASELSSNYGCKYIDEGVSYDVTTSMMKSETTEKVNKNMIIGFKDLDTPDNTLGTITNIKKAYIFNDDAAAYAEGITLISGVTDKVYLRDDNVLNISDTTYGRNTSFTGTKVTTSTIDSPNEEWKSGFMTRVNAGEFKFRWRASTGTTGLGFLSPYKVETKVSGEYPNNVTITPTDRSVLWKENKKIEITPDNGYHISKLKIDGEEVTIDALTKEGSKYTFTFESVVENHSMEVQVSKDPYNVIVHHYKQGTTEQLGGDETIQKYYGDEYTTSPLSSIPEGYVLVGTPSNASGTVENGVIVIYEYKLKDVELTIKHVDEEGNEIIPSTKEIKTYGESYTTNPMENDEYELVSTPANANGTIKENTTVTYTYKKKEVVPETGTITVKYVDEEGNEVSSQEVTTKEIGTSYTSKPKEIEGYELKERPSTESYTYTKEGQTVTYVYERIKLKVSTKVRGNIGGNIEGDEEVLYGNNSTANKIHIKANRGYVISKVYINGSEIEVPKDSSELNISNFIKMNEDKLVEVEFKEVKKDLVVKVPPTAANTIYTIVGMIGLIAIGVFGIYYKKRLS